MSESRLLLAAVVASTLVVACSEFEDPPPASPVVEEIPPTQFNLVGRWDGVTNQGRPMRFDINATGNLIEATVTIHHDCSGGRLVLQLSCYDAKLSGDSFSGSVVWRRDVAGDKFYTGTLTVSGTFAADRVATGGFVNNIIDKQADNLGVCGPSSGTWEAMKSE